MNILRTKKFRYGSVSLALTIVIVAAVILFNAIFTALSSKYLWYLDMTAEQIYTFSDEAKALLDLVNQDMEVTILFCAEEDVLERNESSRYVLYTARDMAKEYRNIHVKYVDYITNPSAVNKYKETSGQSITSSSVIVASGTESRVYSLASLYTYDSEGQSIIGYNGEQRLVSAVLAVTQAESPIVCVTTNHGEVDSLYNSTTNSSPLLTLLYETGYRVQSINLAKEDLPDDCRLLLVFNPQTDFLEKNAVSDISELAKIDAYLDEQNAMMVFFDYDTPKLPNFEDFLSEWGVEIARTGDANYLICDKDNSFDAEGYTVVADFEKNGLGASVTAPLWQNVAHPKTVVCPYTSAVAMPASYEMVKSESSDYWYGSYFKNGVTRTRYDVLVSSDDAVAMAGGVAVQSAPFSYMTLTTETQMDASGSEVFSYLFACASTQFVSAAALDSGYGNHAILAYACNVMGRAVVPVTLECKYFTDLEINSITAKAANQYTVVLTVVPTALIFIAGIYVIVRRKYS